MVIIKIDFNRKNIYLILIIFLCIFGLFFSLIEREVKGKKKREHKEELEYYESIKNKINEELDSYAYRIWPKCDSMERSYLVGKISDGQLLRDKVIEKELLLDIDNENYCDTYSEIYCASDSKLEFKTYIRCKDYEDKGFQNWE